MKALILAAGEGSRFKEYSPIPKPFIPVKGKPIIGWAIDSLKDLDISEFIFLLREEHIRNHPNILPYLASVTGGKGKIIPVKELTDGAARTALLAKELINNDEELIISDCDHYIKFNADNFNILKSIRHDYGIEGISFVHKSTNPRFSFCKIDGYGEIDKIVEKEQISDIANCGIFWFVAGEVFVEAAEQMIEADVKTNSEFYLAPCFNELGCKIPFFVDSFQSLGTPEDVDEFLKLKLVN